MTSPLNLPPIKPQQVSDWMSFVRARPDWRYPSQSDFSTKPIEDMQAEGVAGIWNRLGRHDIAWLADEVGMGKTFQAMGTFALLWQLKSDARILVLAPNQSVAENWKNEFVCFLRDHYKHKDGVVKGEDDEPCHAPEVCPNLRAVVAAFAGNKRFVISKISIFSQLADNEADNGQTAKQKAVTARKNAELEQKRLRAAIGEPLDLLVIDEAHYLRNVNGGSQRVDAARGFFGPPSDRIADRVLLMSATPNHTTNQDISSVLGYFLESPPVNAGDALSVYGIRRLRRLSGKNKYHYRHEKALECDFAGDIEAEVFFALYQKKLAELEDEDDGKPLFRNEKRSFMYGYLEGFETTRPTASKEDNQERADYSNALDSKVLMKLAKEFSEKFSFPRHPKYDQTITSLLPSSDTFWSRGANDKEIADDKTLVFVRRIPSSKELASRVNDRYDGLFLRRIGSALGMPDLMFDDRAAASTSFRDWLHQTVIGCFDASEQSVDDSEEQEARHEEFTPSRVMDYFIKKQEGREIRDTHGSNFRNRFNRSTDLFSLFFAPPLAGLDELGYSNPGGLQDFRGWARMARLERYAKEWTTDDDELYVLRRRSEGYRETERGRSSGKGGNAIETLALIFARHLHPGDQAEWQRLLTGSPCAREAFFQNYLRKGLTLASGAIVELYGWYISAMLEKPDANQLYQVFCLKVSLGFEGSLTQALMRQALHTYRDVREKVARLYSADKVLSYAWNELNAQNPSAFCTGLVKDRARLITAFNTPFFPNTLIATSVLQEGVNLHLNCRRVLHYGITWTPGDNEQRVGRVDRLYGTVHRNIDSAEGADFVPEAAQLEILYPYLKGSFDEDQVGQFIDRKFTAESVLDRGQVLPGSKVIDFSNTASTWRQRLRKPVVGTTNALDPYPYIDDFAKPSRKWDRKAPPSRTDGELFSIIDSLLTAASGNISGLDDLHIHRMHADAATWILEPKIRSSERIHQPVEIRIERFLELSAQSDTKMFCLTMTSPVLTKRGNLSPDLATRIRQEFPLVQVCEDSETAETSFPVFCRCTLPLLVLLGKVENCSVLEVALCLEQLIHGAEFTERTIAGGQDLSFRDIQSRRIDLIPEKSTKIAVRAHARAADETRVESGCNWVVKGSFSSLVIGSFRAPVANALFQCHRMYPFLFGVPGTQSTIIWELRFPAVDFQRSERQLLEKWASYLLTRLPVLFQHTEINDIEE